MKKNTGVIFLLCFLFCMTIIACTNNSKEEILAQLEPCDTTTIGFANDIKPIIDQFCSTTGCHTATTMAGGRDLETFASLQMHALDDKLLSSINHESGASPMPKGSSKMDDCKIKKITRWINQGALNN